MNVSRLSQRAIVFCMLCMMCSGAALAQNTTLKSPFWSRVRFGGGIGIGFNNAGFNGAISPTAYYQVSNSFAAGVGLNGIYSKVNDSKLTAYGGSLAALYHPIHFLQISGEFEQLRVNRSLGGFSSSAWVPALFLGIGYRTQFATVGIRYDVLYDDERSIYLNPWAPFVRFYF
ncbi:alpha-ketoglutarate decarboxylase [Aggregatimonas sangjinii]|uniref:Alpha-ketoglutarate decarboxylase n=1 Tax=Aggregatimonas sangjinii TaxID=2583587 RepID=A0A5B7SRN3_9FLAO|nr:alpha-ketoglutarate decarboxylase [Aggregatimonas sangjinii]QCX01276.1 alpha-ketoglutarate decarboxylase [Aggregatimonas sangjinii]